MYAALDGASPALFAAAQARRQSNSQYNPHYVLLHALRSPSAVPSLQGDSMVPFPERMAKDKVARPNSIRNGIRQAHHPEPVEGLPNGTRRTISDQPGNTEKPCGVTDAVGRYSCAMQSRNGYTLIELLVVIIIVGILAAVMVPMMQGRIDSAKWSEGRAIMGTIARSLRAHISEKGANFTPVPTLEELGIAPGDLNCTYFTGGESGAGDFSWVINGINPINFLITATAPAGISSPSQVTLDHSGTFAETP